MRIARITTSDFKNFLPLTGFLNKTLLFENVGNVLHSRNNFVYPNATQAFFVKCDKNFIYDALYPRYFPSIRRVYLLSHPAERSVLFRFGEDPVKIQIHISSRVPKSYSNGLAWVWSRSHEDLLRVASSFKEEAVEMYYDEYMDSKHSLSHS
jgi:hypothetical protein